MRIATSTIYSQQTQSIDNLSAQYTTVGNQLSTGISLNAPSDNPSVVAQDLTITNTINAEDTDTKNATSATNQLTNTDSILSSLTSVLQSARSLVVEGATDIIPNGTQRPLIGKQVQGLLNEAISLANSQYGNTYVFAGTGTRTTAPVTAQGSPPNGVTFTGNLNQQTEEINGQAVAVGTTLQQAFNYQSTNGSPDVFQLLSTIVNTLNTEPASIQSSAPINVTGQTIYGQASPTQTTLGQIAGPPQLTTTPLTADNAASTPPGTSYYTVNIAGTAPATGATGSVNLTFTNATPLDATAAEYPGPPPGGVVQQINAQTAITGVTATWNAATQRLQLTSVAPNSPPFQVTDVATQVGEGTPPATTAATTPSNLFNGVLGIPQQVSVTSNLSNQLYDIDQVTNAVLSARASIGQQIQNLASTNSQLSSQSVDNTSTKSGYQDTNVAAATSQFTLVQTALQAAYSTTTRLEGKTLLDYLPA
jgi:flagellar hook-associated protein 3 FlgL